MKIYSRIIGIIIFFLFSLFLFPQALTQNVEISKINQWQHIKEMNNVRLNEKQELLLKTNEYQADENTDIILHFNNWEEDASNNQRYQIPKTKNKYTSQIYYLGSASLFINKEPFTLNIKDSLIFRENSISNAFTFEFWLYSKNLPEGGEIFSWDGLYKRNDILIPQSIRIFIHQRTIVWQFQNVFFHPNQEEYLIEIKGEKKLNSQEWSHHMLRFKQSKGILRYDVNNQLETIKYTTRSYKKENEIFTLFIGDYFNKKITIGKQLNSFLDELRLSNIYQEDYITYRFDPNKIDSFILSDIIDLKYPNSQLTNIDFNIQNFLGTDIKLYYKIANHSTPFLDDNTPWLPWLNHTSNTDKGQFLQLKIIFYPETTGQYSPILRNINLNYTPFLTQKAPNIIQLKNTEEGVLIEWNTLPISNLDGYKLYYSLQSKNYLEHSPIYISKEKNKYVLTDLEQNRLYYVRLASYVKTKEGQEILSELSKAKYIRVE